MYHILLVEDNEAIIMGMEYLLKEAHYLFQAARTIEEARTALSSGRIDLVLLDVSLPDGNGFTLCREIQAKHMVPVIFLTAQDEERDVVQGFELGADDYVIKPFRNRELLSRMKNVLRRRGKEESLSWGEFHIDSGQNRVYRGEEPIPLTKLEYKIIFALFSYPNKLFTREELLGEIWDLSGNYVNDNTLTVTVKRLREKIGDREGKMIVTVRGMGYRLGDSQKLF